MAWTYPMTFTANAALTAPQMNTFLRDNMMETEVAKATTSGQFFSVSGVNRIDARTPTASFVVGSSGTDSQTSTTEWSELDTAGPSVTVTTGTRAFVFMSAHITVDDASSSAGCNWALSGATEREPVDTTQILVDGMAAGKAIRVGQWDLIETVLTPGENTFTMKYRVGVDTTVATYQNRLLVVFPL